MSMLSTTDRPAKPGQRGAERTAPNFIAAANAFLDAGLSPFRAVLADKYPTNLPWGEYQRRPMERAEVPKWFSHADAICLICGEVAGHQEVLDFDDCGSRYEAWNRKVAGVNPSLMDSLVVEQSPSGGYHVHERCPSGVGGNQKLAKRIVFVDGPDMATINGKSLKPRPDASGRWYVTITLIETRGEGGLIVCDPTPGYRLIQGSLLAIPIITPEQRQFLLDAARSFDEPVETSATATAAKASLPKPEGLADDSKPWDDFNARGDVRAVLVGQGWQKIRDAIPGDDNERWRRPGKTDGHSATLNGDRLFFCFSGNADPFEEDTAYNPFQVYMLLEHGGDVKAAGRALAKLGYGKPSSNGYGKPAAKSPASEQQPPTATKPPVILDMDEARVARECVEAMAELGWKPGHNPAERVYQRQGRLAQVLRSPDADVYGVSLPDGTLRMRPLPRPIVRERIASAVMLVVETDDGPKVKRPPLWLTAAVFDRGQYPDCVRNLVGIVRSPTLRPDGTVLQVPGYDDGTGLLYVPDGDYPNIEDHPCRETARRAADELLDVIVDFPFAGQAHRSVWLALVETMIGRSAVAGCCPAFVLDANTRGAGKSLAVDAASLIVYGNPLARKTWTADDNEIRKTITAVAIEGIAAILLDNVAGVFGSASLDAAITGTTWNDRNLGTNTMTGDLPLTTVWVATGNNLQIGADTARRVLYGRVESLVENPEDRSGFVHPDLLTWVRENRQRLASAAVTVLRAYVAAGRPEQQLIPWGSFSQWSDLIRSAIVWVGLPDPCETRAVVRAADRSAEILRMFIDGIEEADVDGAGVTSADIARLLSHPLSEDGADPYPTLRAAVGETCDKPTSRRIGYALRQYVGRVCGGRRLVNRHDRHLKVGSWGVEAIFSAGDVAGDAGNGGDVYSPPEQKCDDISGEEKTRELETSPQSPACPAPCPATPPPLPVCDHLDPATFVHREGRAFCRGCGKPLGRVQP
ncbi:MAG: hypothetical protein NTY19_26090 [Planctomycetota bacterium]|nr:hypothetical protein [Planctomycetota bacterium]